MKVIVFGAEHHGAGKTTCAFHLRRLLTDNGHDTRILSFADPVRVVANVLLHGVGFMEHQTLDTLRAYKAAPRDMMIKVGEDIGKKLFSETLWADLWVRAAEDHADDGCEVLIVDDLRFKVELNTLLSIFTKKEKDSGRLAQGKHELLLLWLRATQNTRTQPDQLQELAESDFDDSLLSEYGYLSPESIAAIFHAIEFDAPE